MRFLVALLALFSANESPRFERFNRGTGLARGRVDQSSGETVYVPFFEMATASGTGMGTECACTAITGTKGEAITFSRTGGAWCRKADFTFTYCSGANTPRVTVGETGQTILGLMVERDAQNLLLRNRDLSNAAWTKTNATCTRNLVGLDGSSSTATTCTATAGNATASQSVTASGTRATSFFVKRITGAGTIRVSRDNGSNWIDITSDISTDWKRVQPQSCGNETKCVSKSGLSTNVTNPTIVFEIATSSDAIGLDFIQDEDRTWATSPIDTAGSAVQRLRETALLTALSANFTTYSMAADIRPEFLSESYAVNLSNASSRNDLSTSLGTGAIRFEGYWGGTMTASSPVGWTANTPGTWHRVAGQWNGTAPKACMDGTCNTGTGTNTTQATMTEFKIGYAVFAGTNTQGVIRKVCLDNTATGCI